MTFNARTLIRKAVLVLCAFSILVVVDTDDADARRRRRRHRSRSKRRAVINEPNLYERIGGSKVVSQMVDEWVRAALADGRLSGSWGDVTAKPASVVTLRKNLNNQLCELADGPCKAGKNEMSAMSDEKFVVFADLLAQTMDKSDVREREKNEMLGRLGNAHDGDSSEDEAAD